MRLVSLNLFYSFNIELKNRLITFSFDTSFFTIIAQRTAMAFLAVTLLFALRASYTTIGYDACLSACLSACFRGCFQARTIAAPLIQISLQSSLEEQQQSLWLSRFFLPLDFPIHVAAGVAVV